MENMVKYVILNGIRSVAIKLVLNVSITAF